MKRKWLVQLVLPLLGLSTLFCLLAFAPGRAHSRPPLLEMSVILRENDGGASTLRKGMEQAAADLNVELRFLAPSVDNCAQEQVQLLEREIAGNAAAILLIPADREALSSAVTAAAGRTALTTMETDMTAQGAMVSVGVDHAALGEALGRIVLNGVPEGGTALLLDSVPGDNGIRQRLETTEAYLKDHGRKVMICRWDEDGSALKRLLRMEGIDAVVAFEATALEQVAELAQQDWAFPLLYGVGSTPAIAAGLERGKITSLVAENVFSKGYLAVEATAAAARRGAILDIPYISFSIIRQETMYDPENEKLLFPVT